MLSGLTKETLPGKPAKHANSDSMASYLIGHETDALVEPDLHLNNFCLLAFPHCHWRHYLGILCKHSRFEHAHK